jgi:hypothetical protein
MGERGRVKGASFIRTCVLVEAMVARGQVAREALVVQLSSDALMLLDQKIEPSLWYPIRAVDELSRLLVDVDGECDPTYMRGLGVGTLETLLQRDTFRSFIEGAMRHGSEGATLLQLAGLIYDFGGWQFEGDDLTDFRVIMIDAEPLPELATHTVAGFIEALVAHCTGRAIRVEASRPEPDRVIWMAKLA